MPDYPNRVRLHGGRNTHAAKPSQYFNVATACGYLITGTGDQQLDNDAAVTCRACDREMNR